MTSYQKLKKRIAELEADRVRLLKDEKYYLIEVIALEIRESIERTIWVGNIEPTGENNLKGFWSSLKDQDNNANHQKG